MRLNSPAEIPSRMVYGMYIPVIHWRIYKPDIDVIVTDGCTGNIALKTAEGTANFITNSLKNSFNESLLSKILAFLN